MNICAWQMHKCDNMWLFSNLGRPWRNLYHEIPRNSAKLTKVFCENMRNFGKILPRNFAEFCRNSAKKMFSFVQFRISRNNQIPISWPPYLDSSLEFFCFGKGEHFIFLKKEQCVLKIIALYSCKESMCCVLLWEGQYSSWSTFVLIKKITVFF